MNFPFMFFLLLILVTWNTLIRNAAFIKLYPDVFHVLYFLFDDAKMQRIKTLFNRI